MSKATYNTVQGGKTECNKFNFMTWVANWLSQSLINITIVTHPTVQNTGNTVSYTTGWLCRLIKPNAIDQYVIFWIPWICLSGTDSVMPIAWSDHGHKHKIATFTKEKILLVCIYVAHYRLITIWPLELGQSYQKMASFPKRSAIQIHFCWVSNFVHLTILCILQNNECYWFI